MGVVAGVGVSFGVTRLLSSLLFGVPANDVAILGAAAALLLGLALAANWWPARRATHVNPMSLLRTD